MARQHLNITIYGEAQGVGFRYQAQQMADSLGIKGFVGNQPGGEVYLEAEGEEAALQQLVDWCRHGPAWARVDKIEVQPGRLKNFSGFRISR